MDKSCHVLQDSFTLVTWLRPHGWHVSSHMCNATRTGRRRLIGSLKLQVIFCKRATKYRTLLRKMTTEYKASCDSTPSHTCDTPQYIELCNELMSYVSRTHVMYVSRTHVIDTPQRIACMSHVTRVTVPHSQVWHASPHTCDMTPRTHVTWLNTQGYHTCDMTHPTHVTCLTPHVWYDSSHTCDMTQYTGLSSYTSQLHMTESCHVCHDSFTRMTWFIPHMWHDSLHRAIAVSKVHMCHLLMSHVSRTHVMYVCHDSFIRLITQGYRRIKGTPQLSNFLTQRLEI